MEYFDEDSGWFLNQLNFADDECIENDTYFADSVFEYIDSDDEENIKAFGEERYYELKRKEENSHEMYCSDIFAVKNFAKDDIRKREIAVEVALMRNIKKMKLEYLPEVVIKALKIEIMFIKQKMKQKERFNYCYIIYRLLEKKILPTKLAPFLPKNKVSIQKSEAVWGNYLKAHQYFPGGENKIDQIPSYKFQEHA